MAKRVFGVIFIVLAALFTLGLLLSIPKFAGVLGALFSPQRDAYQFGFLLGNCIAYAFMAALAIAFWIFGIKWVNNTNDNSSSDTL